MPDIAVATSAAPTAAPPARSRWWALGVISLAQLLVVLDATVVNVALPDAQRALGMSDGSRQWVITLYALTFGGLLLLGGRIADFWGRRRTFMVGMVGFAAASALGGLAQNSAMLFAARGLQGVFAAGLAPAALSLLQITFPDGKARAKAFAVYGAIGAGGAAFGLVLGGLLTEYASWRWCLLVNLPVAAIAVIAGLRLLPESKAPGRARYDLPGAVTVTVGLAALVYGFTSASERSWGSAVTITSLVAGVLFLAAFVAVESRSDHPLLPLRIPLHRSRGGAYLASLIGGAALLGGLLFLTYYFQLTLQYTPLHSGLAALPLTAAVLVAAVVATQLMARFGPKPLMVTGPVLAAGGLLLLTRIGVHSGYASHVLPSELLIGLGLGFLFVPLSNIALVGVANHDTGAASALVNATQQIGGAIGTAIFSTLYASSVTTYLTTRTPSPTVQAEAFVHGYTTAFGWAAALMFLAGVTALILIKVKTEDLPTDAQTHLG